MLIFFGTSPRSARFLEQVIKNGLKVDLVVSSPPQPLGRKQIPTENPVVVATKKLQIPFLTSLKDLTRYQDNKITIGLILDYNRIIPKEVIKLFDRGIINIHFSKLPQYRGPAPVQYTILDGDKEAWITYFLITEKVDEGPVLSQTALALQGNETTDILYHKLIEKASQDITKLIKDYLDNNIKPQPQIGNPSYSHKLSVENTKIDWSKSPIEIDRLVRAAYPEPGAWTLVTANSLQTTDYSKKRLKILKAHLENNQLVLDQVQLEGKNPVSWKQFKEGYPEAKIIGLK